MVRRDVHRAADRALSVRDGHDVGARRQEVVDQMAVRTGGRRHVLDVAAEDAIIRCEERHPDLAASQDFRALDVPVDRTHDFGDGRSGDGLVRRLEDMQEAVLQVAGSGLLVVGRDIAVRTRQRPHDRRRGRGKDRLHEELAVADGRRPRAALIREGTGEVQVEDLLDGSVRCCCRCLVALTLGWPIFPVRFGKNRP